MSVEKSVISHFTTSLQRYVEAPPPPDDFAMQAFAPYAGRRLRVLELGCGTGHRLEGLSKYYPDFRLCGIDITPVMIKTARSVRPNHIAFVSGDCLRNPFSDGQFDAIVMYDVLHHLISGTREESNVLRERGLHELLRLLAPGGFIVLEEVCVTTAWRSRLIFSISRLISRLHVSIPSLHIHTDVVLNFFTLEELSTTLDHLGLDIVEQESDKFKGLGVRISTFGSTTHHVRYILKRKE